MNPKTSSSFASFFEDSFGKAGIALGFGEGEESFGVELTSLAWRSDKAFGHEGSDVFIHEFLLQGVDDGDGLAVVGDDQRLAGDDLLEAGGEVVFQIGHTGRFHMARIARI